MKKLKIDDWEEIVVPRKVAVCPICGAGIVVEDVDEWETETGRVTECGLHINCSTAPNIISDDPDDWYRWHWNMPYVDWLPLYPRVLAGVNGNYRVDLEDR